MKWTLKSLRASKNWSQKEASKAVGVSLPTWRNWELQKTFPDVLRVKKIEEVFEVAYDDIIFFK